MGPHWEHWCWHLYMPAHFATAVAPRCSKLCPASMAGVPKQWVPYYSLSAYLSALCRRCFPPRQWSPVFSVFPSRGLPLSVRCSSCFLYFLAVSAVQVPEVSSSCCCSMSPRWPPELWYCTLGTDSGALCPASRPFMQTPWWQTLMASPTSKAYTAAMATSWPADR